jgi:Asp-tRNA(Asn)/Glu-tRNA(Gln) amidotransferase A subunit family amidase
LISRIGIIPTSYTKDVIGPISRTVEDVATALAVMATAALILPTMRLLSFRKSVMELDWRGLAAAFKSTPADIILGGAPGALLDIQLSG